MDDGDREQIEGFEVSEGRSRRCSIEGVCFCRTEIKEGHMYDVGRGELAMLKEMKKVQRSSGAERLWENN